MEMWLLKDLSAKAKRKIMTMVNKTYVALENLSMIVEYESQRSAHRGK